jgi:hypothetical protein
LELVSALRSWFAVWVLAAVAGCSVDTPSVPTELIDGTPARAPPVQLEGVDEAVILVATRVGTVNSVERRSRASPCVASTGRDATGGGVERVGASGSSVTFYGRGRRTTHACDAVDGSWCGHAFAAVQDGRVRDPRLTITCRTDRGDPLGFAWVQPAVAARYVVVHASGHAEAYSVAGSALVRVTTEDVDVAMSRATFVVTEHARDGRLLRAYELTAQVAG